MDEKNAIEELRKIYIEINDCTKYPPFKTAYEALEKQIQISRVIVDGKYFCPKCHNPMPKAGYCICGQKLY